MPINSTKSIDPPDTHLGKRFREDWHCQQLWDVADLAVAFTERAINEARARFG